MEKTNKKKSKVMLLPYLLLFPMCLSVALFSFYPFIKTIISSFSVTDEFGNWIRWAGTLFWKMMVESTTNDFGKMVSTTLAFAVMNFTMTLLMAGFVALLTVKRTRHSKIYQTMFALPMAVASATASIVFKFIFNSEGGLLNTWLGTDIDWLNDTGIAIWMVSEDVLEAATVDGAGRFRRAISIMIPMASPQIFYVVFLNIISALKTFTQINLLTNGGPGGTTTTLMYGIYWRIQKGEYEAACCLSIVLFLVIFLITRIQFLFEKKTVHYQ